MRCARATPAKLAPELMPVQNFSPAQRQVAICYAPVSREKPILTVGMCDVSKFIIVSFGFLALAFYELSGGADFVPEERPTQAVAEVEAQPEVTAEEILVATTEPAAAPEVAITGGGDITLASTEELELDGVTARLSQPLVTADLTELTGSDEEVKFASLSISPDGSSLNAQTTVEEVVTDVALDLRSVDVDALNVRAGPSTGNEVVGRLTRFEIVTVVSETDDGWAQVLIEGDGLEGWVASRFLTN